MATVQNQILLPGTSAPAFTLKSTPDQTVSLTDFKGQSVVLVFFPAAFSPVCGDEVGIFNQALSRIKKYEAQVLGISVDNIWSQLAFAKEKHIHFPLLADFHPTGEVTKAYGVFDEMTGEAKRALFVIDKTGIISWSYVSPTGVNPGVDGVLKALEKLQE